VIPASSNGTTAVPTTSAASDAPSTAASDVTRSALDAPVDGPESRPSSPPPRSPLTIGYILKMFPRFSETFILNEILELERLGHRVIIFSVKQPDEAQVQPRVAQVRAPVHVIPTGRAALAGVHLRAHLHCLRRAPGRYLRTLYFTLGRRTRAAWVKFLVAPYIVRQAHLGGIEHFHAHFASGPARLAKFASLLSGIPFSFTAHAKDLFWTGHQHGKNNKLKKRVRLSSFVVAISDYNRRFIGSLGFKVPNKRVVTISNGLDLDTWRLLRPDGRPLRALNGGAPTVLAVGRLVPKKGFADLVEACRLLRDEGLRFHCLIAGQGPEHPALAASIREHRLEETVTLLGAVPQDRLLDAYYSSSTVLAQPSVQCADGDQDGIPTVILEALAVGLPVVATRISGIAEAVIDEETGLLVPPGDARALAGAIRRVLVEPSLARRLADGGRRLVERRFNLRQNARVLVHLVETAARGQRRWSIDKLRERVGLDPIAGEAEAGVEGTREGDEGAREGAGEAEAREEIR
jgi:glycosyltransferase involved in cell wall biosynthesis